MSANKITVKNNFQTSVNIAYDLNNNDKIKSFIPTLSSFSVIEDILNSVIYNNSNRANILIGAYGRGKSHIILILLSLLSKKDKPLFKTLLSKLKTTNIYLYNQVKNYIESDKKLLPVVIQGSSNSLTQSFLNALQITLRENNLTDIMPDTNFISAINTIENWKTNYPKVYKEFTKLIKKPIKEFLSELYEYNLSTYERFSEIYPTLTAGSTFNPFIGMDVVTLYENVAKSLKSKGYQGVFVVYDEFSKYLETNIANATNSDVKLLQDFAEKCDRSDDEQIHLMLICHKDISNYIDNKLPKEKVDGWRGVSGRFNHINLHNNYSQMYEIISNVIEKEPKFWTKFTETFHLQFEDLKSRFTDNHLLDDKNISEVDYAVNGCFPLHPLTTFILPRLSEKVAQNERTLFTFLSSNSRNTLSSFLSSYNNDFSLLAPDILYDYFKPLFQKEPPTTEIYQKYKLTEIILHKIEEELLETKIVKTISLITIVEQYERLSPTINIITDTFKDSFDVKEINKALDNLVKKECIVYIRRSNGFLKLKETSGINVQTEIINFIERNRNTLKIQDILNNCKFDSYTYPTRYNDEYEITRYFDFKFISSQDFWNVIETTDIETGYADGVIFAVIPENSDEIFKVKKHLISDKNWSNKTIFILPKYFSEIENTAFEFFAVTKLKKLTSDDNVLLDEYDVYIEDLEECLHKFIISYTQPETDNSFYYYQGKQLEITRRSQLSEQLSKITETIFPNTPIINNESINKNILTVNTVNSRNKILTALLSNELLPNLGLLGNRQEVSIARSILAQTKIIENFDTNPIVNLFTENEEIDRVLSIINDFFSSKDGRPSYFKDLYYILTSSEKGIGLKKGLIPLFIAVILHSKKSDIIIKHKNSEVKLTADLLDYINIKPEEYSVVIENWDNEREIYISSLTKIFSSYIDEKAKKYNRFSFLISAMNKWFMALPKYSKELKEEYLGRNKTKKIPANYIKFINTLRQLPENHHEFLFKVLPDIFGCKVGEEKLIQTIQEIKKKYDCSS
ncbi:MAG: hypothetical protein LBM93_01200, partial [Oscillospiraceae bacterium]|nr:hypothetical protein [Oscillospiraceae bacterium]